MNKNTRYLKDKKKVSAQGESLCIFYLKGFKIQNIKECNIKVHIQNVLTKWHWPERPPSRSHPVGHGRSSSLLQVYSCWLLSVCYGIQSGTLCRTSSWILRYLCWEAVPIQPHFHTPRTGRPASASVPATYFMFFPTGRKCQPEGEDIGSGCCGGGGIQLRLREGAETMKKSL